MGEPRTPVRHRDAAGVLLLAGLVLGPLLGGCGDPETSPREAYCAVVGTEQGRIAEVTGTGSPTALLDVLPSFERLEAAAPEDLVDEWSVVVTRVRALRDALAAAEVDAGDYDPADPPASVTPAQQDAISGAARALATPDVAAALDAVQQQARDVCKTPLGLPGAG
ncbi:hypothetical protein [Nocardioides sp.]|uniref:hypothetical protein n=1 Tax=Nocardioides sp. TaxID=35761 RepID=UPI003518AEC6